MARSFAAWALAFLALSVPGTVFAQDEAIQNVVVTATRRRADDYASDRPCRPVVVPRRHVRIRPASIPSPGHRRP